MALQETQPLRAVVSTTGTVEGSTATPRASLALALSTGFSTSERTSASIMLVDSRDHGRHDRWEHDRHHDRDRWPRPFPLPIPIPLPYPTPYPGDRLCRPWEEGRPGSYTDIYGRWWCRW